MRILYLLWFFLFLFHHTSFGKTTSTATQKQLKQLKLFQIILEAQDDQQQWYFFEAQSLLKMLQSLPQSIQMFLKSNSDNQYYIEKKIIEKFELSSLEKIYSSFQVSIPIYSSQSFHHIKVKDYSDEKQEYLGFLSNQNLVPVGLSKKKTSFTGDEKDNYLSHIHREVLTHILYQYDLQKSYSYSREWLKFSGWNYYTSVKWIGVHWFHSAENQSIRGYANLGGLLHPRNDFAIVAANFFAPPITLYAHSIKCRIPRKYQFLKKQFSKYRPYLDHPAFAKQGTVCPKVDDDLFRGLRFEDIYTQKKINIGKINQDTVEGFELLYATPGDREVSEIAGHLLLRMKIKNNPEAKLLQIENPYDVVFAVLADSEGIASKKKLLEQALKSPQSIEQCRTKKAEVNLWEGIRTITQALKGLAGGFYTIFQADTLQYTKYHYTVIGNRTLERYRLNLTKDQIKKVLTRIYLAKKNFKTNYYFFTRNCGSILVHLLGEALNDNEIASYNFFAAPPNSLITLLLKKKLVTPIYPSFYSYTAQAQIAQDLIQQKIRILKQKHPVVLNQVNTSDFFSSDEKLRLKAYQTLQGVALKFPKSHTTILMVLQIAQKAELFFTWNDGRCIQYSTKVKGTVRKIWKVLYQKKKPNQTYDLEKFMQTREIPNLKQDEKNGTRHTGLMSWNIGIANRYQNSNKSFHGIFLEGSIYQQKMGDISHYSLQRGTFVNLGRFSNFYAQYKNDSYQVKDWNFRSLRILKIKSRRHYIPSVFSSDRKLGLGLRILDIYKESWKDNPYHTKVAEGEVFTNLVSSRLFLDYLTLGVGIGVYTPWAMDFSTEKKIVNRNSFYSVPIRLKSLLTFGKKRFFQLRTELEYQSHYNTPDKILHGKQKGQEVVGKISWFYRLPQQKGTQFLLNGEVEVSNSLKNNLEGKPVQSVLVRIGLEVNHW
ncbi:MAG: hypothetical protein ACI86H_000794 [bacterium]